MILDYLSKIFWTFWFLILEKSCICLAVLSNIWLGIKKKFKNPQYLDVLKSNQTQKAGPKVSCFTKILCYSCL